MGAGRPPIPTGIVHPNDQSLNAEVNVPFGGLGLRLGPHRRRQANIEAFTRTRWITVRGERASYCSDRADWRSPLVAIEPVAT